MSTFASTPAHLIHIGDVIRLRTGSPVQVLSVRIVNDDWVEITHNGPDRHLLVRNEHLVTVEEV